MSFIDWSDAEGMFGLLVELVADERAECRQDRERQRFLADLLAELRALERELPRFSTSIAARKLRDLHQSADPEFAADPVMAHLEDCIEELERVENDATRNPLETKSTNESGAPETEEPLS